MTFPDVLIPVALVWTLAVVTPGPNFFITVHAAMGQNRQSALFTVLGTVAGTLIWSASGFFGITVLFRALPALYYTLKLVGGLYLIYLGLLLLLSRKKRRQAPAAPRRLSAAASFRQGLYTNLLNPKTAAFISSLYAATIPAEASIRLGILCIMTICTISALWYSFVALVFSGGRARELYRKMKSWIEKAAGLIFIGFGIKLAVSD